MCHNLLTRCLKLDIPSWHDPGLGSQILLPMGRFDRLATPFMLDVGSRHRDELGEVVPGAVLGLAFNKAKPPKLPKKAKPVMESPVGDPASLLEPGGLPMPPMGSTIDLVLKGLREVEHVPPPSTAELAALRDSVGLKVAGSPRE